MVTDGALVLSVLPVRCNVNNWNGKILTVHRSKGHNVSEVPLKKQARQYLQAYLEWRQQLGGAFVPNPNSPMFLSQDPKHKGERLGYKGAVSDGEEVGCDLWGQ
jgi:site-specific recombinase XerC